MESTKCSFELSPFELCSLPLGPKTFLTVISVGIKKLCSLPSRHGLVGTSCLPSEPVLSLRAKAKTSGYLLVAGANRFYEYMQAPNARIQEGTAWEGVAMWAPTAKLSGEWPQWWDSRLSKYSCSAGQASHPQKNICNNQPTRMLHSIAKGLSFVSPVSYVILWGIPLDHSFIHSCYLTPV